MTLDCVSVGVKVRFIWLPHRTTQISWCCCCCTLPTPMQRTIGRHTAGALQQLPIRHIIARIRTHPYCARSRASLKSYPCGQRHVPDGCCARKRARASFGCAAAARGETLLVLPGRDYLLSIPCGICLIFCARNIFRCAAYLTAAVLASTDASHAGTSDAARMRIIQ